MGVSTALIGWRGYAAALAVGALIAGSGAWKAQSWRFGAEISDLKREYAEAREADSQATLTAIEAVREEERRRSAAVEKARDEAIKQAAAAAADAVGARTERDRLRSRANALASAAVARDPTAADGSPTRAAAVDLLAYMLGRVSNRATELAGIADRARIAGLTCESLHDSLGARR
ncbi:hypothetical protein CEY09_30835 [Achromobacter marplatensis]|uniref:DUF2514 family protein n=1 Tax=Achromobacter marplatensis TaxID=470868 RepID=UPI000B5195B7|nr:DUF2514 family protein [Achromobacter marplatensis]OWT54863.1 hypothetical protein CEY09_30835 [Achromobacter marplatensis]